MPVLILAASFIVATLVARLYRSRTGVWIPGWIGGLSLIGIFAVFAVVAVALNLPALENLFFAIVGAHVGTFVALARLQMEGHWWQIWR